MARVLLGVTGSVAAIRVPELYRLLREAGHETRVVATRPALHFLDPDALPPGPPDAPRGPVFVDADEWPDGGYRPGAEVPHIAFRKWADMLVVAPLDANTLAKFALGLCDNFLACVYRAWEPGRPIVLAPAMNTLMWEHPATRRHLGQLMLDHGAPRLAVESPWSLDDAPALFARHAPGIILVPPQAKRLACGDMGMGAMAEVAAIVETVREWSARSASGE